MNYNLNQKNQEEEKSSVFDTLKKLAPLMKDEKGKLAAASVAIFFNSLFNLVSPIIVGYAVDHYVQTGKYDGVLALSGVLFGLYLLALVSGYLQTTIMGGVGQRVLFNLRNTIFLKLQELPVAFFNQNKAGDLISRINNDTDKLNQFFSQALMQFIGNFFIIVGAGIFLVFLNFRLGLAALVPAALVFIFTRLVSPWVKRKNAANLQTTGGLSAEIQESLDNFKVIVAFNRRDYFRKRFEEVNRKNYDSAVGAGLANNVFMPVYGLFSSIAQLIVLGLGIYFISVGELTIGLLITYLTFVTRFYDPLRHLAALWASFQLALVSWDRVAQILALKSDLGTVTAKKIGSSNSVLEFQNVSFSYPNGKSVLHHINFVLEKGKTYALVGPTGGGKTTTASLMARLYDPVEGHVFLDGKDIRSFEAADRVKKIGFILQEPFLFSGTVRDNILYGNSQLAEHTNEQLEEIIKKAGLEELLKRFEKGLETTIAAAGDAISLGQKQLIAFIRAVLRKPELLILDEATANIDTVTEQLLEDILKKLPATTTRVIIAHRLNTIENADEIFFINNGEVTLAGSMQHAVNMLLHGKRQS